MSYDLCVFYTNRPHTDREAGERHLALCRAEDRRLWIEPDPRVAAFYRELTARFPDDASGENPWSGSPLDRSEGHVVMSMPYRSAREIEPVVIRLAERHGLVCFDPQGGCIVAAPPGIHVTAARRTTERSDKMERAQDRIWIEFIDAILRPRGFDRWQRIWRGDALNTIAALEIYDAAGVREIWLGVWFKARGLVDPTDIGPHGSRHVAVNLRDILPKKMKWRLSHVMEPKTYYAGLDRAIPAERPEWEVAMRSLLDDYVLPWFDAIDANHEDYYGWGRVRSWLRQRRAAGGQ